jgi:hypothetical protein
MPFTKVYISKEKQELEQLITSNDESRKTYDDLQTRINQQKKLMTM